MANEEQLSILRHGVVVWNKWRRDNNSSAQIDLRGADLARASLKDANLSDANLREANLSQAHLSYAKLENANLIDAKLGGATLFHAYLRGADLSRADLSRADLTYANFWNANLTAAVLNGADLSKAEFYYANIRFSNWVGATVQDTVISNSTVYGINVWDLRGEFRDQSDLVITPNSGLSVDNIKIAQFIHLLVNNREIREVINTLTTKAVLILGRFSIPERKIILDKLREKLREYNLLPIVFDFDRPIDKDFTETIKTLAGISYFVIADITNPRSSPLELQATVPDYQIPFVPIIQKGEEPFAMMRDLQNKYRDWVLDILEYESMEELIKVLKPAIIDPAIEKHNELRLIKAQSPKIRSAKDFQNKGEG